MSPPLASFRYLPMFSAVPKRVSSEVGHEVTISKVNLLFWALANMRGLMLAPATANPAFLMKFRRSIVASCHGLPTPGAGLNCGSREVYD
jgi:hypothetical protein